MSSPTPDRQCAHTSKRTGERCGAWAMKGTRSCYHHGGTSKKGIASPNWKTGRYSRHMPGSYIESYEASLKDPERLEQTEEIALSRARVMELLSRVEDGESHELLKALRNAWRALQRAKADDDEEEENRQLNRIGELINRRHQDYAAWNDVDRWLGRQKNLVESERRRMIENQEMIALEHHMALVSAMVSAVKRHVTDQRILARISQEFGALARNRFTDSAGELGEASPN